MDKRFLRIISLVLALVIFIQTTSILNIVVSAVDTADETASETVSETTGTPEIVGEDISKREESVKHFKMSDGTYLAVSYSQPVHYRSEDGSWQEIDNSLKEESQSVQVPLEAMDANAAVVASDDGSVAITSDAYVNSSNQFTVSLPESLSSQSWVGTFHKGYALYFRFENIGQSNANVASQESQGMDTFEQATSVHTSSSVIYENILPGVDVLYQLNGQQLKENIVFDSLANTPNSLSFILWAEDLELSDAENGSYIFTADGNICFVLPTPYMVDSDGESSGTVQVSVEEISEDTYRFTYVPDQQWLQSTERAWPVVLDPVTCATSSAGTIEDTYTRSGYPNNGYYLYSYVYTGYYSGASKNVRAFVQHNATPALSSGDVVTKAQLYMTGRIYASEGDMQVNAYAITEEWVAKTTCWNTQPDAESEVLDFQIVDSTAFKTYKWDVTSAVQRWYSGDLAGKGELGKYGFMLSAPDDEDSGIVHIAQFYSSDTGGTAKPQLLIYYRNTTGVESYWDYTSASAGRAGTVAVNNYTGNLVVSRTDMAYDGNIMPASMSFTYNTNDYSTNIGYGAGWRINYSQTISLITISGIDYYCWIDGDGTAIYFYNNEGTWKDENGLSYTLAVTDTGYTITDRDSNKLKFDVDGRLIEIIDGKIGANKIQITYASGNKILTVTDGAGRQYCFSYDDNNGGNLSSISYMGHKNPNTESALEAVSYSYANGQLETVTYADNNSISYSYENGYLNKATGCQNDSIAIRYGSGSPARVKDVTAKDTATNTDVSSASFLYGDNYTKVTDNNGRWCIYQFNNLGNTVSVYNQRGQALYGSYSDTTPNQLVNSSRLQDTVTNLLSTRSYSSSWSATVTVEAGKTYTLSGEGTGTLTLEAGTASQTSDIVSEGRTEVTITIPDGIETATVSGTSTFSDLQLEQTEAASRYNLLLDTDMKVVNNWMGTNTSAGDGRSTSETNDRAHLDDYALLIIGEGTAAKQYTQTISISGANGDNYSFGGWVKAASAALDNVNSQNESDPERRFGIQVRLMNDDTVVAEKYIAANEACAEWQFISGSVQADAAYTAVEFSLIYEYNVNKAYFDGAQLFKEKFAYVYTYDDNGRISTITDLEGNVTTYEYRGDSSDIVKITLPGENQVYTYSYDETTNLLTGMTSATGIQTSHEYDGNGNNTKTVVTYAGNTGAVMQSNQDYTDDGNFLETVTGNDRNTVTYDYDADNSTLTSITDAKGVETSNEYDGMRRISKTTSGSASVSYAYDVDRLASTYHTGGTRGTTYRFDYTTGGLTSRIFILNLAAGEELPDNLPDGAWELVNNAYNSDTWTLASQTYGNGDAWHYEYNEFDEVVRAYTTGDETGTELQYFYSSEGALARIEQYATTLSGSTITGRTWVSTERYYYDSSDRATRITRQDADGDSYECHWEYDHNDNVTNLVEVVNGQTHTTAYTYDADQRISALTSSGSTASYAYDGFGRLSGQVTKHGESTVLTEGYKFLTVKRTEVEDDGTSKEVEYATSQISELTLDAAGYDRTYKYEYDANGNITSVEVNGKTTSYAYDSLNQLVRENNQAAGKTWVYTYDNGGNIMSRTEYTFTTAVNPTGSAVTANYTYGDTHWGDLLTAYNGQTITYDEIGNPLDDGTWEYTWENGRQLAAMESDTAEWTFKYNADGLRTERSNGTVTYDYIYSGSQLIQMTVGSDVLYFTYDAGGSPMAVIYNGVTYYYATNLQGDIIAILDTDGDAVVEYTYDAWGNILTATNSTLGNLNPLRYRGYVYDTETTLYYLQSRYYDPELGRFINADAYASTGQGILGNNMFAYCNNNPVNSFDASGELAVSTAVIVGSGIAGGLLGLTSYLASTKNPTAVGAIAAIILGAGSAIVGSLAGPADDVAKLLWSAVSGAISAISSGFSTFEAGGDLGDVLSSMFGAFCAGTVTTYLGSYLDTSMFTGFDEGASTFCMTEFSGFFSLPLSVPFDLFADAVFSAVTYTPNYTPGHYQYTRNTGGSGGDPFFTIAFSY